MKNEAKEDPIIWEGNNNVFTAHVKTELGEEVELIVEQKPTYLTVSVNGGAPFQFFADFNTFRRIVSKISTSTT